VRLEEKVALSFQIMYKLKLVTKNEEGGRVMSEKS
jgi:hypothetical protein